MGLVCFERDPSKSSLALSHHEKTQEKLAFCSQSERANTRSVQASTLFLDFQPLGWCCL